MKRTSESRLQTLALTAIFAGSIVVWGLSMWLLRSGLKSVVLEIVEDQAERDSIEPWVRRAEERPIRYQDVVSEPSAHVGRPVVWTIEGRGDEEAWYEGASTQPFTWTNPESARNDRYHRSGWPYKVVAVVVRGGPRPALKHLAARDRYQVPPSPAPAISP